MKKILLALAALSIAGPALAEPWSKQDWYVFDVPFSTGQLRVLGVHARGWTPPDILQSGPTTQYSDLGRTGRSRIAMDINSIQRVGKILQVRYFVWSDKESGVTEMTSKIDCSKTGETIVRSRDFDENFVQLQTTDGALRRIDTTSIAVADHACRLPRSHRVSDTSLPEIVQGKS
jgi:hypothetical protein